MIKIIEKEWKKGNFLKNNVWKKMGYYIVY